MNYGYATQEEDVPTVVPIPKCAYVIFKGQKPRADRANIFAWTEPLSLQPDRFEPFTGTFVPLPKFKTSKLAEQMTPSETAEKSAPKSMGSIQVEEVLKTLEPGDFDLEGYPKAAVLKKRLGLKKLSADEVRSIWDNREDKE